MVVIDSDDEGTQQIPISYCNLTIDPNSNKFYTVGSDSITCYCTNYSEYPTTFNPNEEDSGGQIK